MNGYEKLDRRLHDGGIVILDGGTGTELERRGVSMNPEAWCGTATLDNAQTLEAIHLDYISAGARVITANTYASSRLMLAVSGHENQFQEINRGAVEIAHRARDASGRSDVLVAGSLSHMCPLVGGTSKTDLHRAVSKQEMADAFGELAQLLRTENCDLIILEMMYDPERMPAALTAATEAGLPVWAGCSARHGKDGSIISFLQDREVPLEDVVSILKDYNIDAAGIMHTPSNMISDALEILRATYDGPLLAYPDSGYFKMPQWQFDDVISPEDYLKFATEWIESGVQIVGGCCGLSPNHISALKPLVDK